MRNLINEWFNDHENMLLEDLKVLTAFNSYTGNENEIRSALDFILSRAKDMGMTVGITSQSDAGWAEIGTGDKTLGILVHVDVVGVGDLDKWNTPPFELTLQDGVLYGRGVVDDKGPAIMSLYCLKALLDLKVPLKQRVRLIIGTCEESQWVDIQHYKEQFGQPDYGYSPDGEFPVFNIEKGYCDANLFFPVEDLVLLEAGDSPNTVPSKAIFKQYGGEAEEYEGVSVHSSVPWLGDNAILALAEAHPDYAFSRFLLDNFESDSGKAGLNIDDGSDTYKGIYVGTTTVSPTMLRLDEQGVMLNVNIRGRYGTKKADIIRALNEQAEFYGYSFIIVDSGPPSLVSPDEPFIKVMNEIYEEYGFEAGCVAAPGTSYAQSMEKCVCWGPIRQDEDKCFHEENEHYVLKHMLLACEIYTKFLYRMAADE